ncbi:MAG: STAS domain-containing protein [Candidatus Omnitrophota bacterium]
MQINFEEKSGIAVFKVTGDIDINSSPDMKKGFEKVFKDKKDKVVIDLGDVGYVDSSGLATIVEIFKNMRIYGGKLKLAGLSDKVMGLFEITKLDRLFDISGSSDDAVNSF